MYGHVVDENMDGKQPFGGNNLLGGGMARRVLGTIDAVWHQNRTKKQKYALRQENPPLACFEWANVLQWL